MLTFLNYLLIGFSSLVALSLLVSIPKRSIYLRHYTTLEDIDSIIQHGFNPPKAELALRSNGDLSDTLAGFSGQGLEDKVSFSYLQDSAFSKMLDYARVEDKGYLYIEVPVSTINSKLVGAFFMVFGILIFKGIGVEYVIDRAIVNKQLSLGKYSKTKPKNYLNVWGLITYVFGVLNLPYFMLEGTFKTLKLKLAK